ncbi:hypothetical protein [Neobacillus niacini]|uniref:hypothetical protein n=1 Tax=Neobacillus niacini TaxID=86668 RepID=UPI0005ED65E7|nr:hypothetical protein [Neobacillus niacini]
MKTNVEEYVELEEKLYPIRENWHLLKPYLKDEDVQKVLNEAMTAFCEEHTKYGKMWTLGDAPWEYTTTDYWDHRIMEAVNEDEQHQEESKALEKEWAVRLYGKDAVLYELWDDLWENEEYREQDNLLFEKYYKIHSPQAGMMEWYQFIHGCHWINQFTAALVSKALNVEAYVYETTTHTCATFVKDDFVYYADVQLEWENLDELLDFMGEDVDYYPIFP